MPIVKVQLLNRLFSSLFENNPKLSRDKHRTAMSAPPPQNPKKKPQVLREGTRKTVFVNFMDLCTTYDEFVCFLFLLFVLSSEISCSLIFISSWECLLDMFLTATSIDNLLFLFHIVNI